MFSRGDRGRGAELRSGEFAEFESLETGQIPVILDASTQSPRERIPAAIWTLLAATFIMAIGFGLIVPVLPQYANSFGVDAMLVGVVVSAFAVMRLAWAPVAGPMVDRFGERIMYSSGMLIVAASSFATAAAETYLQLLLFRGLGGIGSVMFTLAASSMTVKYTPASLRGRVSSLWAGLFLIGGITGPFFGGLLAEFGMKIPFVAYGIALILAGLIVAVALRRPHEHGGDAAKQLPPMSLADAWPLREYRASLLFGFANGWAVMGMRIAVVPLFVAALMPDAPSVAGMVVAAGAAGNVLALQWAGRASDRVGRRPLILVGLSISLVGMLLYAFTGELWFVFVATVVTGFGSGLSAPSEQAALADIIGREHSGGRVLATFQMAQDAGQIVGPIVAGLVIGGFGFTWAFVLAACILAMPLVAWLFAPDTLAPENRAAATRR